MPQMHPYHCFPTSCRYIGEICKAYDVPFKPNGESDDNVDAPATGASGGGPAVAVRLPLLLVLSFPAAHLTPRF